MKLYCKKTYKLEFYFKIPKIQFRKGQIYEGEKITIKQITKDSSENYYQLMQINGEDNSHINFALDKKTPHYQLYLKDYFYTEAEMRKMKLDRLSNPFYKFLSLFK